MGEHADDGKAAWANEMGDNPYAQRLEELRTELRAERISYDELIELQGLAEHIDPSDVELLEAAGVPEHKWEDDPEVVGWEIKIAIPKGNNPPTMGDIEGWLNGAMLFSDIEGFVCQIDAVC